MTLLQRGPRLRVGYANGWTQFEVDRWLGPAGTSFSRYMLAGRPGTAAALVPMLRLRRRVVFSAATSTPSVSLG